jgi:PAS domain S-box-containing protein
MVRGHIKQRAQPAAHRAGVLDPGDSLLKKPLRILMLEDVSTDAALIERELRQARIHFISRCVENEADFLRELKDFEPDIILSDFSLPQFNALHALHLMKVQEMDLPFILVTGSQSEETAVACLKEGADDYILKSSLKRLPSAVLSAMEKFEAERERIRAEQALRRSEEYFRSLTEHASDIITVVDRTGTIRYQSPALERVLGYRPEELVGRNIFELIHSEDTARVRELVEREPGGSSALPPIEYRFQHKDGSWRVLESIGKNLLADPDVAGLVVNSRDVTQRKRAEEQIHEQAALLDKAKDAILVHDLENRISFWNKSAERLYGWSAQEAVGQVLDDLLRHSDPNGLSEARQKTLQHGEWHGELSQSTKQGHEIVVESSWTLVSDAQGQPRSVLLINTDITERKRLESQFLRMQRMESIGTLAGGIAHDLNNVLTPITVAIKMLREETNSKTAQEILETLETSAHRGVGIVQQVLSFARGVEGERTVLQIRHPLNEVVQIIKDTFPRSIFISTRIHKSLWPVLGDATQLHQVFMNLSVNARDAMPHGGRLLIEADNVEIDENYARMQPEAKPGPYVVVTITDTGVGIPPDLLSKIFEPFFTTKEVGKGTGLGLSTVLGIVKSHGGFITVYSEIGRGTNFKIYLPAAGAAETKPPAAETRELPRGQGECILVADDDFAIREIIKLTLESHGYHPITANDGAEAVALYAEHRNDVRAVVVDTMMPFMDGPATIRAMQKLNPEARFIAMSGLLENDKVAEAADVSRVAFLPKPFTTEQLLITLRDLLTAKFG